MIFEQQIISNNDFESLSSLISEVYLRLLLLLPLNMKSFSSKAKWLGHESTALINGIHALIKVTSESSHIPSATWGHNEKIDVSEPVADPQQTLNMPVTWP